jgi:hypothetical protein
MTFTGIKDVDMSILMRLEDQDLTNICQVNTYLASLCNDNFYRQRTYLKFPPSANNKPGNISWSEFYKFLVQGDREYQDLLELASEFSLTPKPIIKLPGGGRLSRGSMIKLLEMWINKYDIVMDETMIKNARDGIENAMTYIGGMNHF